MRCRIGENSISSSNTSSGGPQNVANGFNRYFFQRDAMAARSQFCCKRKSKSFGMTGTGIIGK